jgi:2-aminoethylphosphonate-pyruvate transaminase
MNDLSELPAVLDDINEKCRQRREIKLLTPGPLSTRSAVKHAMLTDHCTWDAEYGRMTKSVIDDLTCMAASEPSGYSTVLFQGSGTYAVESMLNCLSGESEKLLLLVNGEYGRRLAQIARLSHKNFDCMERICACPFPRTAEKRLQSDDSIETVAVVHCETTTVSSIRSES